MEMIDKPILETLREIGVWRNTEQALEIATENLIVQGRNLDKLFGYIKSLEEALRTDTSQETDCGDRIDEITRRKQLINEIESNFDDVGEFHDKFGLDRATGESPHDLDESLFEFRLSFLREEMDELEMAQEEGDVAGMADALVDLVYVALGTAHLCDLPWQEVWDEVHSANMRKRRAIDARESGRGHSQDVIKPPGWMPPDVGGVLKKCELCGRRSCDGNCQR
jgi:predicted HAD superfamily Cof-like phosphohydrolase